MNQIFLERILKLIEEHGISRNKMLTDLELSHNSFIDWRKKQQIPNSETLFKIADYFNVSMDYLLGRTDCPDWLVLDENGNPYIVEAMKPNK